MSFKIENAEVDWYMDYSNHPRLKIATSEIEFRKSLDAIRYDVKPTDLPSRILYWGESDGVVSYYFHDVNDTQGFGGQVFELPLRDGSNRSIRGPWSSWAGFMNKYFPHGVDVTVLSEKPGWPNMSATITLDRAIEACRLAKCYLVKITYLNSGAIEYCPSAMPNVVRKPGSGRKVVDMPSRSIETVFDPETGSITT